MNVKSFMEQQQKRFNKLNYESFFLLKVEKNDLGFLLNIWFNKKCIFYSNKSK